jgi:hypothetical protein
MFVTCDGRELNILPQRSVPSSLHFKMCLFCDQASKTHFHS